MVFTRNGVRHLQARTETEYVLPESYYMPQTAKELTAWLANTRWNCDRDFIFLSNGLFLTEGTVAHWHALSDSTFLVNWRPDLKIKCNFDYTWGSFTEQEGLKSTFKRVKAPALH